MRIKYNIGRIIFLILIVLLFRNSYCQENFQIGYVLTPSGDTIEGFIDCRNWKNNPEKVSFRSKNDETVLVYSPIDIKEFKVKDEVYIGAIVEVEVSSGETNDLTFDSKLIIESDTVFLQAMFRGSKSLYYYRSDNRTEQFLY